MQIVSKPLPVIVVVFEHGGLHKDGCRHLRGSLFAQRVDSSMAKQRARSGADQSLRAPSMTVPRRDWPAMLWSVVVRVKSRRARIRLGCVIFRCQARPKDQQGLVREFDK